MVTRPSNPNHYLHRVGMTQQEAEDYEQCFKDFMSGNPLVDLKGVAKRGWYPHQRAHKNVDWYFIFLIKFQFK